MFESSYFLDKINFEDERTQVSVKKNLSLLLCQIIFLLQELFLVIPK